MKSLNLNLTPHLHIPLHLEIHVTLQKLQITTDYTV